MKFYDGNNFYRIKALSQNGLIQYSNIVKVGPVKSTTGITIYPNPVTGKTARIRFDQQIPGVYRLQLINNLGQVVYTGSVKTDYAQSTHKVYFGNAVITGQYQLKIILPNDQITVQQIFIQ